MKTTIKSVKKFFTFESEDGYDILVEGFSDGFVDVELPITLTHEGSKVILYTINEDNFISFIAGCFAKDSNFKEKVFRAYGCNSDTEFCGFRLMINEEFCLITKYNSSVFKIKESILNLVSKFANNVVNEANKEIAEFNSKVEALDEVLENIETIHFKSDKAEELYLDVVQEKEDELSGFGETFVAYVQNFIGKGKSISEIVQEAVNRFEEVGEDINEGINEVQFVCKYCQYGDEIYKAYLDILTKRFSDELGDF